MGGRVGEWEEGWESVGGGVGELRGMVGEGGKKGGRV